MRRWVLLSLAAWLAAGVATAFADVTVRARIFKFKDKDVFELIDKNKFVLLDVEVVVFAAKAAESEALVNQNNHNAVSEFIVTNSDSISFSLNNNSGIVTLNQASGNMNNQANALSVAVDTDSTPIFFFRGFAESQAAAEQVNVGSFVSSVLSSHLASIFGSLSNNSGMVLANQSSGNMNNQANVVSVAVSLTPGVALSEADLGQVNAFNQVGEFFSLKSATINGSLNNNSGIVGVNQSSGNMANQANVVSVAATVF